MIKFNIKNTALALTTLVSVIVGTSGVALAAPDPVQDITCSNGGQAGALWLQWKVPTGADSYEVRYSTDPISDSNYSSATAYTQSWAAGTVGTYKQELMIGLPIYGNYYFAMKAKDTLLDLSSLSATNSYCTVPSTGSSKMDYTPPIFQVTSPTINSTVQSGQDLKVTGTAKDEGGSSVQKVEISVNSGAWLESKITGSDSASNITWEYTIPATSVFQGEISIKVRATDWVNNVSGSTNITVTGGNLTVTPTAPTTAPTTTIPQTTEELKAQLETQLKALMAKLIELLIAQINALKK